MNNKSRYFSSLLIATVAAFGYYMLTDFNIQDIQLKTFSSLGIPFKMYQTNNSVKQKKLPLPKVVYAYAYATQQDELKAPHVELMAENDSDAQEFLTGLTGALIDAEKSKTEKNRQGKISDVSQYGMKSDNLPVTNTLKPIAPELTGNPNKTTCAPTFTVENKVTSEDIEMIVSSVSEKNTKKIEECFKKIKVIYGNENGGVKNIIVNNVQNPNRQSRVTCTVTYPGNQRIQNNNRLKKSSVVADKDDDQEADSQEDSDN